MNFQLRNDKKSPFLFASTHPQPFFDASQYAMKSSLPSINPLPTMNLLLGELGHRQSLECLLIEPSVGDNLTLGRSSSRHSTLKADQINHQLWGVDNGSSLSVCLIPDSQSNPSNGSIPSSDKQDRSSPGLRNEGSSVVPTEGSAEASAPPPPLLLILLNINHHEFVIIQMTRYQNCLIRMAGC
ncbi:hypothetical protein Tco_1506904 [Tanacetum coccineum]